MRSHFRIVIGSVIGISILSTLLLTFHWGGGDPLSISRFCVIFSAFIGGLLAIVSAHVPIRQEENAEPWMRREKLAWSLIGYSFIPWFIGDAIWRYYVTIGQSPFPSLADIGFVTFGPLLLMGLTLQPFSKSRQKRVFLLLDSLIVAGTLLSIAWFLVLGSSAQTPDATFLAKFLNLYYPIVDTFLLSCLAFLLLRGSDQIYRSSVRRISLLVLGCGLGLYAITDFVFNILTNNGSYQEGNWFDAGWGIGMLVIGLAVYLRRFLPRATVSNIIDENVEDSTNRLPFGPAQLLPYFLLVVLFVILGFNVLSVDKLQVSIRPVLLFATLIVIILVIVRQIMTMQENDILMKEQADILKKLEKVYHEVESRKIELETGVGHLKEIQTRLANGDVRARAQIMSGDLWPLATGLNLMADRMMRFERNQRYAQKLVQAVGDLSLALEAGKKSKLPVVIPTTCLDIPELHHLLTVLGLRPPTGTASQSTPLSSSSTFQHQPLASLEIPNNFPHSTQKIAP